MCQSSGHIPSEEFQRLFFEREAEALRRLAENGGPPPCPNWCDGEHPALNPFVPGVDVPVAHHDRRVHEYRSQDGDTGYVDVSCRETLLDGLETPAVSLVFEAYTMTPDDARKVASALLGAADTAEAATLGRI